MSELFEVISADEFRAEQGAAPDDCRSAIPVVVSRGHGDATSGAVQLTWCEFCKGYYNFEYHFGDRSEEGGEIK